jgi:adenylosuccinate synthase
MKKTSVKKSARILIRVNEVRQIQLIEQLKKVMALKSASKVFVLAAEQHVGMIGRIKALEDITEQLRKQLRDAKMILARIHNAHTILGAYAKKFQLGKNLQTELQDSD